MEIKRPQFIWEYKSNPPHILQWDRFFRTITHPLMLAMADGMIVHQWDTIPQTLNPGWKGKLLPGDPSARRKTNLFISAYIDTRWGWQSSYVLGVDQQKLLEEKLSPEGWHYAYDIAPELEGTQRDILRCRIILPIEEQARILVGPKDFRVFTVDSQGNGLPLTITGPVHRSDPKYRNARLL